MDKFTNYRSHRYRWFYKPADEPLCAQISSSHSIPAPLAEVLIKRNIDDDTKINEYFETPLTALINPFEMKDMARGVERVRTALRNNESICVFGDYDVDGVTATSLLYLFFLELGANVSYYIPNRLEEGYGLNIEAVEELARRKINLIITVDCGISAVNEVAEAKRQGIDVVITDHHQPAEDLPTDAYAIINPMQADDTYPFKYLSGVGVAFKLIMGIRHTLRNDTSWEKPLPNIKQYLDIVTLGTIADVVPLNGENRTFVIHGLKVLAEGSVRPGINELKNVAGYNRQTLSASHIGFGLAPRINAVGRLGKSDRGIKLLVTNSKDEARRLAQELDNENRFRQEIEREILKDVYQKIDSEDLAGKYGGLVLYSKDWHPGVLGIVASRVVDRYNRPTIVLTEESELVKGSARSIPNFHLYDGLKELSEILVSFGGHKYAAGLKIKPENIALLQERFDALVRGKLAAEDYIPEILIDSFLKPADINDNFMRVLQQFEPYGNSNKEPIFCMLGVEKYQEVAYVGKDSTHAKCVFIKDNTVYDAIGYDMLSYRDILRQNSKFDLLFTLTYNSYGRNRNLQFVLKDLRVHEDGDKRS
ncbi:MAG: single-stranded-DNA-specific exonuclease RecJ [Deferribacteraceae bacterium]|jgi:single-stranded-DNA-specific exonuclease|nr:single-stranded-DNA-specific exonuclease RecJ [Deferribacteraceae bacterium]